MTDYDEVLALLDKPTGLFYEPGMKGQAAAAIRALVAERNALRAENDLYQRCVRTCWNLAAGNLLPLADEVRRAVLALNAAIDAARGKG